MTKSRTRYDRSSRSPPDRTYFVEQSLGLRFVADRIRASGRTVVVHTDLFASDTPDIVWLAGLSGSGYVLLTKDGRIRRRPLERSALRAAGIHAFFLGNRQIRASQMADAFVTALPRIERILAGTQSPYWGSVHLDGRITKIDIEDDADG